MNKERNLVLNNEQEPTGFIPKLITGGKGGGDGENWLYDLMPGTVFLARANIKNSKDPIDMILTPYIVVEHKAKVTNLEWLVQEGRQVNCWVCTLDFSRAMKYFETLAILPPQEAAKEKETEDGKHLGTIQSTGLPDDAAVEGRHSVDEGQGSSEV